MKISTLYSRVAGLMRQLHKQTRSSVTKQL